MSTFVSKRILHLFFPKKNSSIFPRIVTKEYRIMEERERKDKRKKKEMGGKTIIEGNNFF